MHADMFGLTRKPFLISPDPNACHFRNPNIDKARDDILRGLRGHTGLVVLTGPVGCGKTALLLQLREDLEGSPLISVAVGPEDSTQTIFHTLYEELGLEQRDTGGMPVEEALLRRLEREGCDHGAVRILVDDAHNLTSDALAALVRLASPDPVRSLHVQLLLSGLPDVVASLEQLNLQRFQHVVTVWARLENLRREDVAPYVWAQVADAGGDPRSLFPIEALDRMADYTEGNPALINMLCDLCLETAQLSAATAVTERTVDAVASSHGLSRRRGLRRIPSFGAPRAWMLQLRGGLDRTMMKIRNLKGEPSMKGSTSDSQPRFSRRAGERVAWAVGIVGLAILVTVIVLPAGPGTNAQHETIALTLPVEEQTQPVQVLSLQEEPTASLPARPEPVAAGDARNEGSAEADTHAQDSQRLREEIKTLQAELDLMKTRERRMSQELKLVRSERDRLLAESRSTKQVAAAAEPTPVASQPAIAPSGGSVTTAQAASAQPGATYTVARGDTLWGISRKHGVSVNELSQWNGLSSGSSLKPGQTIVVRDPSRGTRTTASSAPSKHYEVQRGDTLYGISRRFNVSVSELSNWNNLQTSASLRVGQTLVVSPAS